jgi:type I restriction enzyme R subunit
MEIEEVTFQKQYNADQIRFLRAVQSVFLQNRHLETADVSTGSTHRLYEPPLDLFGADAVERWFTDGEVREMVRFTRTLEVVEDSE